MLNDAFFFVDVVVAAAPDVLRAELLSPLLAGGPDLTPEEESAEDDDEEVSWDFLGSVEERGRALVELWFLEEGAVALEDEEEDEEPFCKEPVGLRGDVMGEAGGLVREAGIVVVFSSALSLMVMRFVDGFPERERGLGADEREGEDGGREAAEKEGGFVEGPSNGLCDNVGEGEDEAEEAAEAAARRWEISLV